MGHIRHHSMVVTGWDGRNRNGRLRKAWRKAKSLFRYVSNFSPVVVNGYQSFFIPPDGSKEGWEESDEGDTAREGFKTYLRSLNYGDGSSPLAWVEVQFGDDNGETKIVSDSDEEFERRS